MPLISIEQALEDIKAGKMVILVDDEDRENEGDLTIAAEKVTPEIINFMARYGRGLVCLSMTGEKLDSLNLPMMVKDNTSQFKTGFTVSIEARRGARPHGPAFARQGSVQGRARWFRLRVIQACGIHNRFARAHKLP